MKIDILTLFPEMFAGPFDSSILRRAQDKSLVEINIHNLRDWATDKHKAVDDRPYGGGAGMVLRVDVIDRAVSDLKKSVISHQSSVILLDAGGETFNQQKAQKLSKLEHIILIAGHYEGVDHRVHEYIADKIVSIGNYVLTGGELPAMVVTDATARLIPGVIDPASLKEESFSAQYTDHSTPITNVEYPQYTRPEVYKNWRVPEVLLSGNHAEIEKWRKRGGGVS